jgi:hypothetical protein
MSALYKCNSRDVYPSTFAEFTTNIFLRTIMNTFGATIIPSADSDVDLHDPFVMQAIAICQFNLNINSGSTINVGAQSLNMDFADAADTTYHTNALLQTPLNVYMNVFLPPESKSPTIISNKLNVATVDFVGAILAYIDSAALNKNTYMDYWAQHEADIKPLVINLTTIFMYFWSQFSRKFREWPTHTINIINLYSAIDDVFTYNEMKGAINNARNILNKLCQTNGEIGFLPNTWQMPTEARRIYSEAHIINASSSTSTTSTSPSLLPSVANVAAPQSAKQQPSLIMVIIFIAVVLFFMRLGAINRAKSNLISANTSRPGQLPQSATIAT